VRQTTCGIDGNEMADSLFSVGSSIAQYANSVKFSEAKTFFKNRCRTDWRQIADRQLSGELSIINYG
jgi:hypothetical protein